jgi:hypothetical protein
MIRARYIEAVAEDEWKAATDVRHSKPAASSTKRR